MPEVTTPFKGSRAAATKAKEKATKATRATKAKKAAPRQQPVASAGNPTLHFSVNGKRMGSPPGKGQNTLGGVAFFHTRGITQGKDRITVAELSDLLATLGVPDPRAGAWEATLPNGKTITAEVV